MLRKTLPTFSIIPQSLFRKLRLTAKPNSLKFEISLLLTFLMGIILTVFCGVLYFILMRAFYTEVDNNLKLKANGISYTIRAYLEVHGETPGSLKYAVKKAVIEGNKTTTRWWMLGFDKRWSALIERLNIGEDYIDFVSPHSSSLFRSSNMDYALTQLFLSHVWFPQKDKFDFRTVNYQGAKIRLVNILFNYRGQKENYLIQVGTSLKPLAVLLQDWLTAIFLSIPVIMILAYFIGQLLVLRILTPVEQVTSAAQRITYENLGNRVQSNYSYQEINNLAIAFNDMISRLEKSFQHVEEFSSHIAHELKTPLTILRGETEVSLLDKRTVKEYQNTLRANLEEIARMLKVIDDLLLLTRADYQPEVFNFEKMNFMPFLKEIYEQSHYLAKKKNITMNIEVPNEDCFIRADEVHLRRLFFNLIDNAIKFTPVGGEIYLKAKIKDRFVETAVCDTGPGIAEKDFDKIFERFYRTDIAKDGSGLGLSIVDAIAKVHYGKVKVDSRLDQGATFTVVLPVW